MGHTRRNRAKISARIKRISGQLSAVERALDADKPCGDVLQLIAAARGAMNGLMSEVLEEHLQSHVLDSAEMLAVVRTYFK